MPDSDVPGSDQVGPSGLRFFRVLSGLAVLLVPCFGFVYRFVDPTVVDPIWARAVFATVPLAVLLGTYLSSWVRRHVVLVWRGLMYTIMAWFVGLCVANQFSMLYVLGLIYVATATGAAFHVGMNRVRPFLFYMGFTIGATGLGLWLSPRPEASPLLVTAFVVSVALIFVPVSRWRIDLERKIRTARDTAREASELKSALLMNMSHEIRTPLTAILGFTDLLEEEVEEDSRMFVEEIRSGGERLLHTLNTVIDLAQIEAGVMDIGSEPVDLSDLVESMAAAHRNDLSDGELTMEVELVEGSLLVHGHRGSLERILHQLLDNAIKFTERGRIRLSMREEGTRVALVVEDTGRGMDPEFIDRAFLPFAQASSGTTRSHEGTGLGLTLVHRLTKAMEGHLDVETDPGEGSRFTIWLQRVTEEAEDGADARGDDGAASSGGDRSETASYGRSTEASPSQMDASIGSM
jgi:signal transduction histidine kinase